MTLVLRIFVFIHYDLAHLRPELYSIRDGVHCQWMSSNKIATKVDLLQGMKFSMKTCYLPYIITD